MSVYTAIKVLPAIVSISWKMEARVLAKLDRETTVNNNSVAAYFFFVPIVPTRLPSVTRSSPGSLCPPLLPSQETLVPSDFTLPTVPTTPASAGCRPVAPPSGPRTPPGGPGGPTKNTTTSDGPRAAPPAGAKTCSSVRTAASLASPSLASAVH